MKITCPKCSTKYRLSEDNLKSLEFKVKCSKCQYTFVIRVPKESIPVTSSLKLPEEESVTLWRIRVSNGLVYGFNDSSIIKNWIKEQKVGQDDEVCYANGKWQKINEVDTFKKIFERLPQQISQAETSPDKTESTEQTSLDPEQSEIHEVTQREIRKTTKENIPEIVIDDNQHEGITNPQFKEEPLLSIDEGVMNEEIPLPMDYKPLPVEKDVSKSHGDLLKRNTIESQKPAAESSKKNIFKLPFRWLVISCIVVITAGLTYIGRPLISKYFKKTPVNQIHTQAKTHTEKPKDTRTLLLENPRFQKAVDFYRFDTLASFQLAENEFLKLSENQPDALITGYRALNFAMWGYVSNNASLINQALELISLLEKNEKTLKDKTLAIYYLSKDPTPENIILLQNSLDALLSENESDPEVYCFYGLYYLKNALILKATSSFVTSLKYDKNFLRSHKKLLEIAKSKEDTVKANFHQKYVDSLENELKAKYPELTPHATGQKDMLPPPAITKPSSLSELHQAVLKKKVPKLKKSLA